MIRGFSWTTSQYGLAVDNVLAFEVVEPDGTAVSVTAESDSELFFGLKVSHVKCPVLFLAVVEDFMSRVA